MWLLSACLWLCWKAGSVTAVVLVSTQADLGVIYGYLLCSVFFVALFCFCLFVFPPGWFKHAFCLIVQLPLKLPQTKCTQTNAASVNQFDCSRPQSIPCTFCPENLFFYSMWNIVVIHCCYWFWHSCPQFMLTFCWWWSDCLETWRALVTAKFQKSAIICIFFRIKRRGWGTCFHSHTLFAYILLKKVTASTFMPGLLFQCVLEAHWTSKNLHGNTSALCDSKEIKKQNLAFEAPKYFVSRFFLNIGCNFEKCTISKEQKCLCLSLLLEIIKVFW